MNRSPVAPINRFQGLENKSIIPEGRIARITHWNGDVTIKQGPARAPLFSRVELFDKIIVPEGEQGYLINENGGYQEYTGPAVVHVHPEANYKPHHRFELANYEAMVVIDENGVVHIYQGSDSPTVWVKDRQRIHNFHWTGSIGNVEDKVPGALNIQILRLQDTQTYYSFSVRTKDNIIVILRLMIYYGYGGINLLMENNDPLSAMYNKIMSTMVSFVATLTFDEFKEGTNEKITGHPLFNQDKVFFSAYGIGIQDVVVRSWEPVDISVQRVLEKAAIIQTEKALDTAEHERKIAKLDQEKIELNKAKELDNLRLEAFAAEGSQEGQKLLSMYETLESKVGEETARRILLLRQAAAAKALYVTPTLLDLQ